MGPFSSFRIPVKDVSDGTLVAGSHDLTAQALPSFSLDKISADNSAVDVARLAMDLLARGPSEHDGILKELRRQIESSPQGSLPSVLEILRRVAADTEHSRTERAAAQLRSDYLISCRQCETMESLIQFQLDFLIRTMGNTSALIFLPVGGSEWALGACLSYQQKIAEPTLSAIGKAVASIRGSYDDSTPLTEANLDLSAFPELSNRQLVTVLSKFQGEPMAVQIVFRQGENFDDRSVRTLCETAPLFGRALRWLCDDLQAHSNDSDPIDVDTVDGEGSDRRRSEKRRADWWKEGGLPPEWE